MATLPKEQDVLIDAYGPHLNRMEGLRLDTGVEPDKIVPTHCCFCGQQCGIQPQGQRQRRHRLRAAVRLPVQQGDALPEGREALPAGRAPRPPPHGAAARSFDRQRVLADRVRRSDRARRFGDRAHSVDVRPRRLRRPQRRQPHHREGVPHGQVRPRLPEDAVHRLQRPALHGQRGRGEQEGVRHRPQRQSVGRHPERRGRADRRLEHRRSARRSRRTTSGRRARTAGR